MMASKPSMTGPAPAPLGAFPPLARTRIQALACEPPAKYGLSLTHWSVRDLTVQILKNDILTRIHYSSVCLILQDSELQPHRYHYWKTQIAPDFIQKAARVLWLYERAEALAKMGIWVVCFDEKPAIQALERRYTGLPMLPGRIERQEYEYVRHGVLHWLVALVVHSGEAWGHTFRQKSQDEFAESVDRFMFAHPRVKQFRVVLDNDPTHQGGAVTDLVKTRKGRLRLYHTPAHASWLDQAEILLSILSRKYLKRGSWDSRRALSSHLRRAVTEYNRLSAHPFDWSFTRHAMRNWHEKYSCRN